MAACSAGFFRTTATTYPSQQDLALFGELLNVGVREGLRVYTKWIKMMAISEMLERSLRPSCIIQCATVFGSHSYEIWWCREIKSPPSLNKINHCPMMSHVMQERLYRGDFCLCQSRRMGFSPWTSRADEKWIGHTGDLAIIGHHGHLNWKRFKRGNGFFPHAPWMLDLHGFMGS